MDEAAGAAARRVLRWAATRRSRSDLSWIDALSTEIDEIETGRSQLAWALGALRLIWTERRPTMRSTWHGRMVWVGSAGGLGGWRVYPPAVVGGLLIATWSYSHRQDDLLIPVLASLALAPYYGVIGVCWGRSRTIGTAALVGAVTAVAGFGIVVVLAAGYAAVSESGLTALLWLVFGLVFGFTVALVGAFSALVGAVLAHPTSIMRQLGR